MDNVDTDSDLSFHGNEFTPINSPRGKKMDALRGIVKKEHGDEDEESVSAIKDEESEEEATTPVKATPSKNKKGTPGSGKRRAAAPGTEEPKTPSKKSKKSTDNGTPASEKASYAKLPPIPTSRAAAGEWDLMILRMRDDENKPWPQINKDFFEASKIKVGGSTLRMRYNTMKANFTGVTEEDGARLMRFKKEIEEKFEQEKWHRIVNAIQADGGDKYPAATLQKKFKELSKNAAASAQGAGDDEE
ncbi:uncharacterized protein DSM5745_04038 [Aspergillus mulundensis]|uniref:Uncharacterized protein n=1 Tax=Aspergillus mulundensis TaxID=1810919 RepID=A0A3D8SBH8_9EURO|nr:hypothetical protein DSM5745_04038 [Aspergillus mulundensis]RDW83712.1 hypothetical protein DSM5745_04038 [Aspergillus mulundensis]